VQDNYLDFIHNFKHVLIIGGAGTGKTWLAMKKAVSLSEKGLSVLFVCFNKALADFARKKLAGYGIACYTFDLLAYNIVGKSVYDRLKLQSQELEGIFDYIQFDRLKHYDAIIVDEAQDFTEEWAITLRFMLKDDKNSYLYVFYDKDQNIFKRDFKNGFAIDTPPFVLRENLRNTKNIFQWIKDNTHLGTDTIPNMIEGAEPEIEILNNRNKVLNKLNLLLNKLILREYVPNRSVLILSNRRKENSVLKDVAHIGQFSIVEKNPEEVDSDEVCFRTVQSYKGLEADIVIFLDHCNYETEAMQQYVAYTRAKFYLYIVVIKEA
jgi:superfamily I DNA/RNA helicase